MSASLGAVVGKAADIGHIVYCRSAGLVDCRPSADLGFRRLHIWALANSPFLLE